MKAFSIPEVYCCACLCPLDYLPAVEQPKLRAGIAIMRHPNHYVGARICVCRDQLFEVTVTTVELQPYKP